MMRCLYMAAMLVVVCTSLPCDNPSHSAEWNHVGPAGYGNYKMPESLISSGAAQAMTRINNGTGWLVATANGGIWKSNDILDPRPHWVQVLDGQPVSCTSISAMEAMGSLVLAGCGSATSSEMGNDWMAYNNGDWGGLMISRDYGATWKMTKFPPNYFITAIVIHSQDQFVVSARAEFLHKNNGGVWASTDGGDNFVQTLKRPVYDLILEPSSGALLAACPWITSDSDSVLVSKSGGLDASWSRWSTGIKWDRRTPFYPTFALGKSVLFVGALTVNPENLTDTASGLFSRAVSDLGDDSSGSWVRVPNAPARLDQDGMPKDRMALLVHPHNDSMLFVAGNADALTWRVDWQSGVWTSSGAKDTRDGSYPHADCRRQYWEPISSSLLLLNDGGAFIRRDPEEKGGVWKGLAGDTGAMELVSAHWDPNDKRWVGGAQDNTVMFAVKNARSTDQATGFIFGDGTVTAVDSSISPSRLWGSTQFLGNVVDDDMPGLHDNDDDDDDDSDDNYGFGFWQDGKGFVGVPLLNWFSVIQFPFFVQPFALNSINHQIYFYASNGERDTVRSKLKQGGIYQLHVSGNVSSPDEFSPPELELSTEDLYAIVAGGVTEGKSDPDLLVGMNDTHLLHRSGLSGQVLLNKLPVQFAKPIVFQYKKQPDGDFGYILGPTSHDRTVSLAVSPADSSLIAVTGWTSLTQNDSPEGIWLSKDAGRSFTDITGDLRTATGVMNAIRPSSLLMIPLVSVQKTALLVGTSTGVFIATVGGEQNHDGELHWSRLGDCSQLPLVLVAGLSYEPKDDTLVAATMGRGVYVVKQATKVIEAVVLH